MVTVNLKGHMLSSNGAREREATTMAFRSSVSIEKRSTLQSSHFLAQGGSQLLSAPRAEYITRLGRHCCHRHRLRTCWSYSCIVLSPLRERDRERLTDRERERDRERVSDRERERERERERASDRERDAQDVDAERQRQHKHASRDGLQTTASSKARAACCQRAGSKQRTRMQGVRGQKGQPACFPTGRRTQLPPVGSRTGVGAFLTCACS